jgi:5S rRNA maturation endonuclease (ribonuclease M5)
MCQAKGIYKTFMTEMHARLLKRTTREDYLRLKNKRGIASQTFAKHEWAYDSSGLSGPLSKPSWWIPFKNADGNIVNIQFYYPEKQEMPNKYNLPRPVLWALYGFDRLKNANHDSQVLLCEGPLDAVASDYAVGANNRPKYVVVATPGSSFKAEWAEHFKDRKVWVLSDNDKGGDLLRDSVRKHLGESRIAKTVEVFNWPSTLSNGESPGDGYDINDLVKDCFSSDGKLEPGFIGFISKNCVRAVAKPKLIIHHGRKPEGERRPIEWPWPNHLRLGTYASFSGWKGTQKSTVMLDISARYTTGRPMPTMKAGKLAWEAIGMPAGHVLFIHAEDDADSVEERFDLAGGDFDKWHRTEATTGDGGTLNILENLQEIEEIIRQYGIRLVIVDGQNSVVGAPQIATDMKARTHLTNPLHQFAMRLNICLLGIRNEDRDGRALGAQSMGDIGRCELRAEGVQGETEYYRLQFPKVNDTARSNYPDIPYSVEDLSKGDIRHSNRRRIVWGKVPPPRADKPPAEVSALGKSIAAEENLHGTMTAARQAKTVDGNRR